MDSGGKRERPPEKAEKGQAVMHYITIGLLATTLLDQAWIPMVANSRILADMISFGVVVVTYMELEGIWKNMKRRISQ